MSLRHDKEAEPDSTGKFGTGRRFVEFGLKFVGSGLAVVVFVAEWVS